MFSNQGEFNHKDNHVFKPRGIQPVDVLINETQQPILVDLPLH
jgi:hypothetical protein